MKKLLLALRITTFLTLSPVGQAEEKDLYKFLWLDKDKNVYVLQNKTYPKRGTTYMELGFLSHLSNEYQETKGLGLKTGHFLTEEIALEVMYKKYKNSDSNSLKSIRQINQTEPFIRRPLETTSLLLNWSPFYGKVNTFNKIFYFDWSFKGGASLIKTETNATNVTKSSEKSSFTKEENPGLTIGTGLRVHLTKKLHLNFDYSKDFYQAPGPTVNDIPGEKKWRSQSDFMISIGFSF